MSESLNELPILHPRAYEEKCRDGLLESFAQADTGGKEIVRVDLVGHYPDARLTVRYRFLPDGPDRTHEFDPWGALFEHAGGWRLGVNRSVSLMMDMTLSNHRPAPGNEEEASGG
jgi:hypothetical protein